MTQAHIHSIPVRVVLNLRKFASNSAPKESCPTRQIIVIGTIPRDAAATAWFASFPPQLVSNDDPMTVPPIVGRMDVYDVKSWLALPTTTTPLCFVAVILRKEGRADGLSVVKVVGGVSQLGDDRTLGAVKPRTDVETQRTTELSNKSTSIRNKRFTGKLMRSQLYCDHIMNLRFISDVSAAVVSARTGHKKIDKQIKHLKLVVAVTEVSRFIRLGKKSASMKSPRWRLIQFVLFFFASHHLSYSMEHNQSTFATNLTIPRACWSLHLSFIDQTCKLL